MMGNTKHLQESQNCIKQQGDDGEMENLGCIDSPNDQAKNGVIFANDGFRQHCHKKSIATKDADGSLGTEPAVSSNQNGSTSIGAAAANASSSPDHCHDALSYTSAAMSIQRSFEMLSKLDLEKHDPYEPHYTPPDFSRGVGVYGKEMTQAEIDDLVTFAREADGILAKKG